MSITRLKPTGVNQTDTFTMANLSVSGNVTSGNAELGNAVIANYFVGNGYYLTGISGGGGSSYSNSNVTAYLPTYTGNLIPENITSGNVYVSTLGSGQVAIAYTSGKLLGGVDLVWDFANAKLNTTSITATGNISANYFSGNGSLLTSITGSNVTGYVPNSNIANIAGTVTTNSQPNITSVGTLSSLTVTSNVSAGNVKTDNLLYANGTPWTFGGGGSYANSNVESYLPTYTGNLSPGNLKTDNLLYANGVAWSFGSSSYSNSNVSDYLPTYTGNLSPGNLKTDNLLYANGVAYTFNNYSNTNVAGYLPTYSGNVSGAYFIGNGSSLTFITASNISGQVANSLISGTVYTNAQPNITSVGTLNGLTVSGNIIPSSNVVYNLGNSTNRFKDLYLSGNTLFVGLQTISTDANGITMSGNLSGDGSLLSNLNANSIASGTLSSSRLSGSYTIDIVGSASTVTTNAQPNITSVGSLSGLSVSGDATVTGNLTVSGSYEYANVTSFNVKDPIIEQGGNPNGTPLASNDGKDRGQLLHYYSSGAIDAFMGWDNSNSEFAFGSNVSVSSEVVTFNNFGNIRAGYFVGNGSQLTGLPDGYSNTNVAAYLSANPQPGTYSNTNVASYLPTYTGNLSPGNLKTDNLLYANGVAWSFSSYSNTNVGEYLPTYTGLIGGTLSTGAQPNVTSTGTLTSLSVTGNITAGNLKTDNLLYANGNSWAFNNYSNTNVAAYLSANPQSGTYANSNVASYLPTYTGNIQAGNITVTNNVTISSVGEFLSVGNASSSSDKWLSIKNQYGKFEIGTQGNVGAYITNWANSPLSFSTNYTTRVTIAKTGETQILSTTESSSTTTGALQVSGGGGFTGNVFANYFSGNGSLLTGITATTATTATTAGTVTTNAQPNITSVGTLSSLAVSGTANLGSIGNMRLTGGTNGQVLNTYGNGNVYFGNMQASIVSTVSNIQVGSDLSISVTYANAFYPAGLFTLSALGPLSLTMSDIWSTSSTSTKNAYANYEASSVNTSNIAITLTLANSTFNIQSTDNLVFGSSIVTGANLTGLGITGTGGTYLIPSGYLSAANTQTNSSISVSANLTTQRGIQNITGTTLTNTQPVRFNVTAIPGTFTNVTVPYWSNSQSFSWSATLSSGATVASGNVTYSNSLYSVSGTLTSSGATSGTSPSINSTYTYTISSNDYTGSGINGAGSRKIPSTVSSTVTPSSEYYPLFYKITGSSANPNFTTSDTYNAYNYYTGDGAYTSSTASNYLFIATPTSTARSWAFTFLGQQVSVTPDVTYTSQTISGQTYNVYGFTNYSSVTQIYSI